MMVVNVTNTFAFCAATNKYFFIMFLLYIIFIMNMQFWDICILILQYYEHQFPWMSFHSPEQFTIVQYRVWNLWDVLRYLRILFASREGHVNFPFTDKQLFLFHSFLSLNPLNAKLNPICHLLALLGALHIFHVSRVGVKMIHPNVLQAIRQ